MSTTTTTTTTTTILSPPPRSIAALSTPAQSFPRYTPTTVVHRYDELQRALNEERTLLGFNTARPQFAPTFKVTKGDPRLTEGKGLMAYVALT